MRRARTRSRVTIFRAWTLRPRPLSRCASLRTRSAPFGYLPAGWDHRVGLHLFCDGLAIELSDREIMVDVGHGRPVREAGGDPVEREDRDFIDAVRGG